VKFSLLLDLTYNKLSTIADMCGSGSEEGGAAWQLRLRWAWKEGLLTECRSILHVISLQSNSTYQWQWSHDLSGGYSVRKILCLAQSHHSNNR
jgi:hypothetical protein